MIITATFHALLIYSLIEKYNHHLHDYYQHQNYYDYFQINQKYITVIKCFVLSQNNPANHLLIILFPKFKKYNSHIISYY